MSDQAIVEWGGVSLTQGFNFPFQPMGIQPSVCNVNSPPHSDSLTAQGPLTLRYGSGSLTFADCRLERPRLNLGRPRRWTLPILDRRWKWRFGVVDGLYNLRQPDDTLLREQTPQQLATLLLDAMGETGYQISNLPADPRPEVRWQSSNPAAELEALCIRLGCVLTFNPFADRVEIFTAGQENTLPAGQTVGGSAGFTAVAAPDSITAFAAPTLFQSPFTLEAVGEDIDGVIKPIADLSYKPPGGWGMAPYDRFESVTGTYTKDGRTLNRRDLAASSVYRLYRVTGLPGGGWSPPLLTGDDLEPQSREDLQILPTLAEESTGSDGAVKRLPARLEGKWVTLDSLLAAEPANEGVYTNGLAIDAKTGVVRVPEPLFLVDDGTKKTVAASIRLVAAFYAGAEGRFSRHSYEHDTGESNGTLTEPLQVPAAQRVVAYYYVGDTLSTTDDNQSVVDGELQDEAEARADEYTASDSATVAYVGFVNVPPDGTIRQVIYQSSKQGAFTTVARNREAATYVPSLEERRRRTRLDQQQSSLESLQQAALQGIDLTRVA